MQYGYGAPSFGPYGGFQGAGFPGFGPPPPMPHGMGYQQPYGAPRQIGGSPRPSYKSGMLMHSPRQPPQAIQGGIPNTSNQPQPSQPLPALVTEHSPRFPGAYYSSMGGTGGHGDGDAAHAVYGSYQGPSYQHQPYQPKPYQAQPYPEPTNLFTFKTPGSLYTSQMPPSMAAGYEHAQSSGTVQVPINFGSSLPAPSSQKLVPRIPSSQIQEKPKPAKKSAPTVRESTSTVGLMLWPGKSGNLVVTGFKESTDAASSHLVVGDVISTLNGQSMTGKKPEEVAKLMVGQTGSTIIVETVGGQHATLVRDVPTDVANSESELSVAEAIPPSSDAKKPPAPYAKTLKASPRRPQQSKATFASKGQELTDQECSKFGVPKGTTWAPGSGPSARKQPPASQPPVVAKTPVSPAKTAKSPAPTASIEGGRQLSHAECASMGVPYGSRFAGSGPSAARSYSVPIMAPTGNQVYGVQGQYV